MLLKPMRFKDYTWPHNPEIYAVEYRRQIAAHKIPLGGWYLQDLGRTYRIFRGEGIFAGERAYEEFQTLAEVFDQTGPGLLVHPVWRTVSAYFVTLELMEEPKRDDGRRIVIDGTSPILSCTLREDHYGVLTEVLVIDKTRNVSYSVQNRDMLDRGGQCRRVVYTPGQSTWAAMRYTGEYQIRQSREEELTIELGLAGCFPAFPGDTVRLELEAMGLSGEYRVAEAENTASPETGEVCTLILRERI